MKTAIILISEAGLSIAQSLLNELPDSEIFTLRHEEGCTHIESAGKFTAENFNRYDAFVFIGAMGDRKSTRLNSSHSGQSRMPSSA